MVAFQDISVSHSGPYIEIEVAKELSQRLMIQSTDNSPIYSQLYNHSITIPSDNELARALCASRHAWKEKIESAKVKKGLETGARLAKSPHISHSVPISPIPLSSYITSLLTEKKMEIMGDAPVRAISVYVFLKICLGNFRRQRRSLHMEILHSLKQNQSDTSLDGSKMAAQSI